MPSVLKAVFKKLKKQNINLSEKIIQDIRRQCIDLVLKQRKHCCILNCSNTDLLVYYCKSCKQSQFVCSTHFRGRTRSRICPVCETRSITLRCAQRIN